MDFVSDLPPCGVAASGRVLRLRADAPELSAALRQSHIAALVVRSHAGVHCLNLNDSDDLQFRGLEKREIAGSTQRGLILDRQAWVELWWYQQERHGQLLPCVEAVDAHGHGLLKLCYRDQQSAQRDQSLWQSLTLWETDAWELLHLQSASTFNRAKPEPAGPRPLQTFLRQLHQEMLATDIELPFVLHQGKQCSWNSLRAVASNRCRCHLAFLRDADYLLLDPQRLHHCEVIESDASRTLRLHGPQGQPALTLVLHQAQLPQSHRRSQTLQKIT